jgi:hypothetical protein
VLQNSLSQACGRIRREPWLSRRSGTCAIGPSLASSLAAGALRLGVTGHSRRTALRGCRAAARRSRAIGPGLLRAAATRAARARDLASRGMSRGLTQAGRLWGAPTRNRQRHWHWHRDSGWRRQWQPASEPEVAASLTRRSESGSELQASAQASRQAELQAQSDCQWSSDQPQAASEPTFKFTGSLNLVRLRSESAWHQHRDLATRAAVTVTRTTECPRAGHWQAH